MRKAAIVVMSAALIAIGGWVYAQAPIVPYQAPTALPAPGDILAGSDIGVRVEGAGPGRVVGSLVVRLKDGTWVPLELGRPGIHKLNTN
jgi:hypothetical protein